MRGHKTTLQKFYPWIFSGLTALLVILILNLFLFKLIAVSGSDMRGTLKAGDLALVSKMNSYYSHNDILVFKFTNDDSIPEKAIFFQRCIALPGDSVKIKNGTIYLNGEEQMDIESCQYNYHIKTAPVAFDSIMTARYNCSEGGKISNENDYSYSLTKTQIYEINKDSLVLGIEQGLEKKGSPDETIFPHTKSLKWNKHYFGSVCVPKKGTV